MPRIDEIAFAKLVSGGKVYRNTCIVSREGVDGRWWRKNGSAFSPDDFAGVVEKKPEIVILGTGFMNRVNVLPETLKLFGSEQIECEVMDSQSALGIGSTPCWIQGAR
jgi:hypothetical protein